MSDYISDVVIPMRFDGQDGYFVPMKVYVELVDKQDASIEVRNLRIAIDNATDHILDAKRTLDNA
jgi:hypothetical protein